MEEEGQLSNGVKGRVMALDTGEQWIGVALSDPLGILASPLTRISALPEEAAIREFQQLVDEYQVKLVVVGMPYSMDGTPGKQAARVEEFVTRLRQALSVCVQTWDERLSTVAARSRMRDVGSGKAREKEQIDAAAAAYILEGYLERQRAEGQNPEDPASDQP